VTRGRTERIVRVVGMLAGCRVSRIIILVTFGLSSGPGPGFIRRR